MPNPNPKTEHLVDVRFKAPDTNGGLVNLGVRVDPDIKEWLRSLPEGTGFHVRQALREYRERLEKKNTSS